MINSSQLRQRLSALYGNDSAGLNKQMARYTTLLHEFQRRFPNLAPRIFSTPGRTEIGGNHTDHNHGKVLAAGVNLDSIAAAVPAPNNRITIFPPAIPIPFLSI